MHASPKVTQAPRSRSRSRSAFCTGFRTSRQWLCAPAARRFVCSRYSVLDDIVSSVPDYFLLFGSNPAKKLPPSLLQDGQLAIPWLHDRWSHEYSLSAFVTDLCTALQTSPASSCSPVHPLRLEMNQNNSKQLQPSAPTMPSGFGKHWDHPGLQRSSRFTHYCGLCVTSNRSDHGLASTDEIHRVQVQMAKVRVAIHCGHPQERRRVPATRQVAFLSPT
jgi:hypothetical protein